MRGLVLVLALVTAVSYAPLTGTASAARWWEGRNNSVLKSVARRFWFWGDGYHLRPEGAAAYSRLVAKALGRG